MRIPRLMSRALPFLLLFIATGCAPLEKRVDLTYERFVNATGGSGQLLITQPVMKQDLAVLPSGKQLVGKADDADVVIKESPADWLLSALVQELSAAGYDVKTAPALPVDVSKGVRPTILALSANQSSKVLTVTTVTEVKLEAQLWKNGQLIKTLTAGARDQEEGTDRSSEPIRWALEKTLQRALQELVPDIVKSLE
ncbi:MAG TPA: hypothetical protein VLX12_11380 [Syntrophorhabdales bacterium]|nr:hypothetical protein [Syntrophorhabdales bacterium]